jgi:pimeloyl-ACP methyl ester carboxylesterase
MELAEKQIGVGEFTINYVSGGGGEPLLFLHGSEPAETWQVWEPIMGLADTYRVLAPDLIGYGKSSRPTETPSYRTQAQAMGDLLEKLQIRAMSLVGSGWGGQVALELGLVRPESVKSLVLIASTYDKDQLRRLGKLRRPTLIIYAEDDMVTQLKAGYLLRDAIGSSRLEVLESVARDPRYDFRMSHRLQKFRAPKVLQLIRLFLSKPDAMISRPPELENELRGMELRRDEAKSSEAAT